MKANRIKHFAVWVFAMLALACLCRCASFGPTKPNPVYQRPYPPKYNELLQKNPLLAQELGKLPELQDGISEAEAATLRDIADIYNEDPTVFDKAFEKMYRVGIPEVRKYCSPLQALFWLAEDGELNNDNNPVIDYSLDKLLDMAWGKYRSFSLSDEQLLDILDDLKDDRKKKTYLLKKQFNNNDAMWELITQDYSRNRNIFSKKAQKVIEQSLKSKYDTRWKDFITVVERLNAPELIDYYERKNFRYVDWRTLPTPSVSPSYVFKYNEGECVSITGFTIYCLQKGGYKARELRVSGVNAAFHAVCLFKMNGERYIMDNGRPNHLGIIPFKEYRHF